MENHKLHGAKPYKIITLHGGPGALGELRELSKILAKNHGVIEFLQTEDSIEKLLKGLENIITHIAKKPVKILGYSWGAWLGILFAARYPKLIETLVLISSGPFLEKYSKEIMQTRVSRMSDENKDRFYTLANQFESNEKLDQNTFGEFIEIIKQVDSYKLINKNYDEIDFHHNLYKKIWLEASLLRKNNRLVEQLKKVNCSIKIIHGKYDPHPVKGVVEPLDDIKKDFDYKLLEKCGHIPWKEKFASESFYKILNEMIK